MRCYLGTISDDVLDVKHNVLDDDGKDLGTVSRKLLAIYVLATAHLFAIKNVT